MLLEEALRDVPLTSHWNDQWDFVAMEDDSIEEPKSVGDFAEMNRPRVDGDAEPVCRRFAFSLVCYLGWVQMASARSI